MNWTAIVLGVAVATLQCCLLFAKTEAAERMRTRQKYIGEMTYGPMHIFYAVIAVDLMILAAWTVAQCLSF